MTLQQVELITNTINPITKAPSKKKLCINKPEMKTDIQSASMPIGELLTTIEQSKEKLPEEEALTDPTNPRDIYETISKSFAQLIENTKESQDNITHHKRRASYLKQQIGVAEMLINEQGVLAKPDQEDDEKAIESTKKTVVKHDCKRIEAFATSMSQLVTDNQIDEALEAFDQMNTPRIYSSLKTALE